MAAPQSSTPAAASTPAPAPAPVNAPPPLLAAPDPAAASVMGPPMPSRARAATVRAVVQVLLSNAAATESVVGVYFSRLLVGGGVPGIPGLPDGAPVMVLGPTFGLALLAVVNSPLGRDLKITSRKVHGRTVYFVTGPGLHGIVLVFGSALGSVLVIGNPTLLPPTFLTPTLSPEHLFPSDASADLLPAALLDLARRSESTVLATTAARREASAPAVRPAGEPTGSPTGGAPATPVAPIAPGVPAPAAPVSSSSSSVSGAQDGGHAPVSAVLVDGPRLQRLMFAGLVRLRQWSPAAPTAQLIGSPG